MDNARIHAMVQPTVEGLGYAFWGLEHVVSGTRTILRIYIEGQGENTGVTIDDCQKVSKQVNAVLNVEEPIAGQYTLEVSSPGINRRLFNKAQLARYVGHIVKFKMQYPIDGQRNFKGCLSAVEGDEICLEQDEKQIKLPYNDVEKAKLIEI